MNAPGLSVVAIGSPVRVIRFHESPSSSLLVGFHLLLAMAVHLLMRLDVAGNAQRFQVSLVVCQPLHLLLSLGCFDWHLVVYVYGRAHEPFALAPLAQRMCLQVCTTDVLPPGRVQQSLVSWVTAHGSWSNGLNPSYSKPSSAFPLNSPSLSCNSGRSGTSLSSKWMLIWLAMLSGVRCGTRLNF